MAKTLTILLAPAALALGPLCTFAVPASALDPALARICREKAIAAHPTKPAGSASGHAQAQREFFNQCIADGGKTESSATPPDTGKKADGPASPPPP